MIKTISSFRFLLISFCILVSLQLLTISPANAQNKNDSIKFKDMPVKLALKSLASYLNLTLEFDSSVENVPLTIEFEDTTIRKAIENILTHTKLKGLVKDNNVLLIFADTAENREKYSNLKDWNSVGTKLTANCTLPESSIAEHFTSADELRKRITGRWISCGAEGWWGIKGTQKLLGVEFTDDGHWYTLFQNDSGTIVRGRGFDHEGSVEIIDISGMNKPGTFQVNVNLASGGAISMHPVFSDSPRKMRLISMAGTITYVPEPAKK